MLRRHHSSRVDRRKSTSSISSKYEPMDPDVARKHALAAAMLAFTRAQERNPKADVGRSTDSTGRSPNQQQERVHQEQPRPTIKRQQSVRFAGPQAVHHGAGRAEGRQPHTAEKHIAAHLQPVALTTNAPVPAAYRPPSRTSSIGKGSISKATANHLVMVNDAFDELYTREDDVASTPSSYRRVRRSKSMVSPGKAPSIFYTNGTPERNVSRLGRRMSFRNGMRQIHDSETASGLRAPKSMSFLRDRANIHQTVPQERNDAAIQLARDRFFTQTTQQRLREQPSFLFRSKAQRQERSFRKSVRSGSDTQGYGAPISSVDVEPTKDSNLKNVARKASKSLRLKIKRVFGRSSKDDEPVEIPNQQVVAKETHVRRYLGDQPSEDNQYQSTVRSLEPSLWQVNSRVPSVHKVASNQHLRSQNGSVRSARSVKSVATDHSDDKSRVTSWTSTGVNTLNSNLGQSYAERELQRLSVIKENGTHVPSSSFPRSARYPPERYHGKENSAPPPNFTAIQVDSARVYSALMKRLDGHDGMTSLENAFNSTAPAQSVSRDFNKTVHKSRSQATIRRVTSVDNSIASFDLDKRDTVQNGNSGQSRAMPSGNHVKLWVASANVPKSDDVFSTQSSISNKENIPPAIHQSNPPHKSGLTHQASTSTLYYTAPGKNVSTPQEIANRNETSVTAHRPLRESRSTFFGSTSAFPISRTPSPYRRALAETDRSSRSHDSQLCAPQRLSPLRNPLFCLHGSNTSSDGGHEPGVAYSESVYSRTTSGAPPNRGAASPVFDFAELDHNEGVVGDAIILDQATYRPAIAVSRQHKVSGSTGSVEWQKWMSSEVAKLERSRDPPSNTPYINYALPTMPKFHHAGHAKSKSDSSHHEIEMLQQPVGVKHYPTVPNTTLLRTTPVLRPILKNRSVSSFEDPESHDVRSVFSTDAPPPPPPPPPPPLPVAPSRLPHPRPQAKSGVNLSAQVATTVSAPSSAVKTGSLNGRNVLHKRNNSTTTLRSVKSMGTPAKLVRRPRRSQSRSPKHGPIVGISLQRDNNLETSSQRTRSPARSRGGDSMNSRHGKDDLYHTDGAGLLGPDLAVGIGEMSEREAQSLGSKRMVDMFLNSRRRRIASTSDDGGTRAFI